jgi:hypothetical protein
MKRAGRLLSKIEFITLVALTAVALAVVVGSGLAAAEILEIFCKACVALVNAAVAFAKALVVFWVIFVAFANVSVTFSDMALVALVVLVNPAVVVVDIRDLLALGAGKEELDSTFSEDKLSMNNRDTSITAEIVFMCTLFVLLAI